MCVCVCVCVCVCPQAEEGGVMGQISVKSTSGKDCSVFVLQAINHNIRITYSLVHLTDTEWGCSAYESTVRSTSRRKTTSVS